MVNGMLDYIVQAGQSITSTHDFLILFGEIVFRIGSLIKAIQYSVEIFSCCINETSCALVSMRRNGCAVRKLANIPHACAFFPRELPCGHP